MSATIPGIDRMYFLGPFAKRISFSAQQARAFNLLHALLQKGRLEKDEEIAVVGAGLAGLTLATALYLLGFKVTLFEGKPSVLARQRNTKHRHLHPSINQWPFNNGLDPTTALPFFNWHTDICVDVLAGVIREWERLAGDALEDQQRIHFNTRVTDYLPVPDGVNLLTEPKVKKTIFGQVFFATGFEEEKLLSKLHRSSYWRYDEAEDLRDNKKGQVFVVSGTGDGGLIDALRLCYRNISVGALALTVATRLTGRDHDPTAFETTVGGQIKKAEERFADTMRSAEAEATLFNSYREAAKMIPSSITQFLNEHRVGPIPAVYLVGQDATLTARDAAPIHKLLAAWSLSQGLIHYIPGKVVVTGKKISIRPNNPNEPVPREQPTFLITRHGADNSLKRFLKRRPKKELGDLIARQTVLADQFADPIADFFASLTFDYPPDYDAFDPKNSEQRATLAKTKIPNMVRIWPQLMNIKASIHGYAVQHDDTSGWYPPRLFGSQVTYESLYPDRLARPEKAAS